MTDVYSTSFSGFIPRIKKKISKDTIREVILDSRDAKDVLEITQRSYFDRTYDDGWKAQRVQMFDNKELAEQYRAKRAEMKDGGKHGRELQELFTFLLVNDEKIVTDIAENGLKSGSSSLNSIGNPSMGVYVCRHADIQLRMADFRQSVSCRILVFKVTQGKCKLQIPQIGNDLEPTPNYDCHISATKAGIADSIFVQNTKTQLYLYEYNEDCETVERPRHCLPYAAISYTRTKPAKTTNPNQFSFKSNKSHISSRPGAGLQSLNNTVYSVSESVQSLHMKDKYSAMHMRSLSLDSSSQPGSVNKVRSERSLDGGVTVVNVSSVQISSRDPRTHQSNVVPPSGLLPIPCEPPNTAMKYSYENYPQAVPFWPMQSIQSSIAMSMPASPLNTKGDLAAPNMYSDRSRIDLTQRDYLYQRNVVDSNLGINSSQHSVQTKTDDRNKFHEKKNRSSDIINRSSAPKKSNFYEDDDDDDYEDLPPVDMNIIMKFKNRNQNPNSEGGVVQLSESSDIESSAESAPSSKTNSPYSLVHLPVATPIKPTNAAKPFQAVYLPTPINKHKNIASESDKRSEASLRSKEPGRNQEDLLEKPYSPGDQVEAEVNPSLNTMVGNKEYDPFTFTPIRNVLKEDSLTVSPNTSVLFSMSNLKLDSIFTQAPGRPMEVGLSPKLPQVTSVPFQRYPAAASNFPTLMMENKRPKEPDVMDLFQDEDTDLRPRYQPQSVCLQLPLPNQRQMPKSHLHALEDQMAKTNQSSSISAGSNSQYTSNGNDNNNELSSVKPALPDYDKTDLSFLSNVKAKSDFITGFQPIPFLGDDDNPTENLSSNNLESVSFLGDDKKQDDIVLIKQENQASMTENKRVPLDQCTPSSSGNCLTSEVDYDLSSEKNVSTPVRDKGSTDCLPLVEKEETTSSSSPSLSSDASTPRPLKWSRKKKREMIGYVRRKKKKPKNTKSDTSSDQCEDTDSIVSVHSTAILDGDSEDDLNKVKDDPETWCMKPICSVGLTHWSQASKRMDLQPVVLLADDEIQEDCAETVDSEDSQKKSTEALGLPCSKTVTKPKDRVREWISVSKNNIKLTLKKPQPSSDLETGLSSSVIQDHLKSQDIGNSSGDIPHSYTTSDLEQGDSVTSKANENTHSSHLSTVEKPLHRSNSLSSDIKPHDTNSEPKVDEIQTDQRRTKNSKLITEFLSALDKAMPLSATSDDSVSSQASVVTSRSNIPLHHIPLSINSSSELINLSSLSDPIQTLLSANKPEVSQSTVTNSDELNYYLQRTTINQTNTNNLNCHSSEQNYNLPTSVVSTLPEIPQQLYANNPSNQVPLVHQQQLVISQFPGILAPEMPSQHIQTTWPHGPVPVTPMVPQAVPSNIIQTAPLPGPIQSFAPFTQPAPYQYSVFQSQSAGAGVYQGTNIYQTVLPATTACSTPTGLDPRTPYNAFPTQASHFPQAPTLSSCHYQSPIPQYPGTTDTTTLSSRQSSSSISNTTDLLHYFTDKINPKKPSSDVPGKCFEPVGVSSSQPLIPVSYSNGRTEFKPDPDVTAYSNILPVKKHMEFDHRELELGKPTNITVITSASASQVLPAKVNVAGKEMANAGRVENKACKEVVVEVSKTSTSGVDAVNLSENLQKIDVIASSSTSTSNSNDVKFVKRAPALFASKSKGLLPLPGQTVQKTTLSAGTGIVSPSVGKKPAQKLPVSPRMLKTGGTGIPAKSKVVKQIIIKKKIKPKPTGNSAVSNSSTNTLLTSMQSTASGTNTSAKVSVNESGATTLLSTCIHAEDKHCSDQIPVNKANTLNVQTGFRAEASSIPVIQKSNNACDDKSYQEPRKLSVEASFYDASTGTWVDSSSKMTKTSEPRSSSSIKHEAENGQKLSRQESSSISPIYSIKNIGMEKTSSFLDSFPKAYEERPASRDRSHIEGLYRERSSKYSSDEGSSPLKLHARRSYSRSRSNRSGSRLSHRGRRNSLESISSNNSSPSPSPKKKYRRLGSPDKYQYSRKRRHSYSPLSPRRSKSPNLRRSRSSRLSHDQSRDRSLSPHEKRHRNYDSSRSPTPSKRFSLYKDDRSSPGYARHSRRDSYSPRGRRSYSRESSRKRRRYSHSPISRSPSPHHSTSRSLEHYRERFRDRDLSSKQKSGVYSRSPSQRRYKSRSYSRSPGRRSYSLSPRHKSFSRSRSPSSPRGYYSSHSSRHRDYFSRSRSPSIRGYNSPSHSRHSSFSPRDSSASPNKYHISHTSRSPTRRTRTYSHSSRHTDVSPSDRSRKKRHDFSSAENRRSSVHSRSPIQRRNSSVQSVVSLQGRHPSTENELTKTACVLDISNRQTKEGLTKGDNHDDRSSYCQTEREETYEPVSSLDSSLESIAFEGKRNFSGLIISSCDNVRKVESIEKDSEKVSGDGRIVSAVSNKVKDPVGINAAKNRTGGCGSLDNKLISHLNSPSKIMSDISSCSPSPMKYSDISTTSTPMKDFQTSILDTKTVQDLTLQREKLRTDLENLKDTPEKAMLENSLPENDILKSTRVFQERLDSIRSKSVSTLNTSKFIPSFTQLSPRYNESISGLQGIEQPQAPSTFVHQIDKRKVEKIHIQELEERTIKIISGSNRAVIPSKPGHVFRNGRESSHVGNWKSNSMSQAEGSHSYSEEKITESSSNMETECWDDEIEADKSKQDKKISDASFQELMDAAKQKISSEQNQWKNLVLNPFNCATVGHWIMIEFNLSSEEIQGLSDTIDLNERLDTLSKVSRRKTKRRLRDKVFQLLQGTPKLQQLMTEKKEQLDQVKELQEIQNMAVLGKPSSPSLDEENKSGPKPSSSHNTSVVQDSNKTVPIKSEESVEVAVSDKDDVTENLSELSNYHLCPPLTDFPIPKAELQAEAKCIHEEIRNLWQKGDDDNDDDYQLQPEFLSYCLSLGISRFEIDLAHKLKNSGSDFIKHDLQALEDEIQKTIERYLSKGVIYHRLPDEILLQSERTSFFTKSRLFLILSSSMQSKTYHRLVVLRKEIERNEQASKNQKHFHNEQTSNFKTERLKLMTTYTGMLNRKKLNKVRAKSRHLHRCYEYLNKKYDVTKQFPFLVMTLKDVGRLTELMNRLKSQLDLTIPREDVILKGNVATLLRKMKMIEEDISAAYYCCGFSEKLPQSVTKVKSYIHQRVEAAVKCSEDEGSGENLSSIVNKLSANKKLCSAGKDFIIKKIDEIKRHSHNDRGLGSSATETKVLL